MKVNQTFIKNQACTNLLYIYLEINQNRDLILLSLVNIVNRSPSQRDYALGFIKLVEHRNGEIKEWIRGKILGSDNLACNLFVTSKLFWSDPIFEKKIRNYFEYLDVSLLSDLNKLDSAKCVNLQERNAIEHCKCNRRGSLSLICDLSSRCKCKPHWEGKLCEVPPGIYN